MQAGEDETLTKLSIDFTMVKTDDDQILGYFAKFRNGYLKANQSPVLLISVINLLLICRNKKEIKDS
jgi:hypothetical protein